MPTTLLNSLGLTIDPSVSEPRVASARPMEEATALPDEEPEGSAWG